MNFVKLLIVFQAMSMSLLAKETFEPYRGDDVPQNVTDLWKDYDPRKEDLNVKIVKEWKADGVITRYITFKVGTFKGTDSRIAARLTERKMRLLSGAMVVDNALKRIAASFMQSVDMPLSTSTGTVGKW